MSEEAAQDTSPHEEEAQVQPPSGPASMATANKKRPRLDLTDGVRERKRGKSMFGLLLGTLNKAKIEDKERNASEAAKKRQLIDQRLQNKLRKETDTVRRAEEAKKEKTSANRKEEDLQLKDSIYKLRRTRIPLLANFLLTSDNISSDDPMASRDPLSSAPRSHPPPLYYLPAILLPEQEEFLTRRKAEVSEAAESEWSKFSAERTVGIEEITHMRQRVAEEEERKKAEKAAAKALEVEAEKDVMDTTEGTSEKPVDSEKTTDQPPPTADADMDVDDGAGAATAEPTTEVVAEKKEEPMQADDDDVVEY